MRRRYVVKVCPSCLEQANPEGPPYCASCAGNPEPVVITLPASLGKIRHLVHLAQLDEGHRRMGRKRRLPS